MTRQDSRARQISRARKTSAKPKPFQAVSRFKLPLVTISGAPVVLTTAEVVSYAKRIDAAVQSLEDDMYGKIVYTDPAKLRARAKDLSEMPDPLGSDEFAAEKKKAVDALNQIASSLETRAKTRSSAQVEAEQAFGTDYELFVGRWKTFFNVQKAEEPDSVLATIFTIIVSPVAGAGKIIYGQVTVRSAWTQIEGFESEFRRYYARFKELGYTPSSAPPPSNEDIAKEHPGGGLGSLVPKIDVPWGTIAVLGVAGFLGYTWLTKGGGSASAPATTVVEVKK